MLSYLDSLYLDGLGNVFEMKLYSYNLLPCLQSLYHWASLKEKPGVMVQHLVWREGQLARCWGPEEVLLAPAVTCPVFTSADLERRLPP